MCDRLLQFLNPGANVGKISLAACALWRLRADLSVGLISKIACEIELKTGDRISVR